MIPRVRLRRTIPTEDTHMPDSSAGQQAPKRSASAHPEEPESRKPTPNAPKMDQPSSSSASASAAAAEQSAASTKGKKNARGSKSDVKHGTQMDKSMDEPYWKGKGKGYILDQLALRGHRTSNPKQFERMTIAQLSKFFVTLPIPKEKANN